MGWPRLDIEQFFSARYRGYVYELSNQINGKMVFLITDYGKPGVSNA